jgi:hypothetical protein
MNLKVGIIVVLSILLFLPSCDVKEKQTKVSYKNVRVSALSSINPQEVTIAVNPTNPKNLAAGANLDYYYYSTDGGENWTEGRLTSTLGVSGDPAVIFDRRGILYYSHLSSPPNGDWLDRIVVQKSTDGGISWDDGVGIGLNAPKDQDKEWMIADCTDSVYRDNIYISWTEFDKWSSTDIKDRSRILCSYSADFGRNWSKPVVVSDKTGDCIDSDNTVEGAVPAVGSQGQLYISWSGPLGILFDKSMDGGVTFGKDVLVTQQPGGWDFDVSGISRCNGMPVTLCDTSESSFRGHVYIVWSDQRNGEDDTDIFLTKSIDGGKTWGPTLKINTDKSGRHQFFPWATIDPKTGNIYVVFYDRRNTKDDETEVWVAKSNDGGNTFTDFKVSEQSFTPLKKVFFGDYLNIAAFDGMVYPIWARMVNTSRSVWIAIVKDK